MKRLRKWRLPGLLVIFLATIYGPLTLISVADIDEMAPIHFAVIGDRTGEHQPDVYEEVVTEVARLRPDFIMTVGDMIEGYTDDSAGIEEQWQDYRYLISPITSPIHFTPGNHELWSDRAEASYKEHVGRTYYSFNYEKVHFIVLDNSRWESSNAMPSEQLDWLARDLKMFKSSYYTVVFMHKPFWWETIVYNKPDTLHQLFKQYGVDAVFSGHFHQYFSAEYDNIKYTCCGSSGADMGDDFGGMGYHYLWVTLDYRGIHIAPVRVGNVLAWEETSIADRKVYEFLRRNGITFEKPILVAPDLTVANSTVSFTVDNSLGNYPVLDTMRWESPGGWKISPRVVELNVPAHERRTYSVNVGCKGDPFPAPLVEVGFEYSKEKRMMSRKSVPLERTVYCASVEAPPVIDGALNEEFWKHPEVRFFDPSGGGAAVEPTQIFFAHDAEHLYIAAVCQESQPGAIRSTASAHDGAVYSDDCVGLFIAPAGSDEQAFQIYFSANGTIFDQKLTRDLDGYMDTDASWNGIYDVKTTRSGEGWTLEACLSLAQMGASMKTGDRWKVNFRRKQARLGKIADWQIPLSSDPQSFGVLVAK